MCIRDRAVTVARIIQNRERVHPGTYLGKGKIDEVRELLWDTRATGVICDDELSPAQLRNLEDALDTKVMDRTMVILDIFASRASTRAVSYTHLDVYKRQAGGGSRGMRCPGRQL